MEIEELHNEMKEIIKRVNQADELVIITRFNENSTGLDKKIFNILSGIRPKKAVKQLSL